MLANVLNKHKTFLFSIQALRYRSYNTKTKLSSDEKLLNDILREEPDEDVRNSREKDIGYRKTSSLSKFQKANENSHSTNNNNDKPLAIGPKYWKNKYRKSYKKVEQGLITPLDAYLNQKMDVVESYNKKHKQSIENRIKLDISKQNSWEDIIHNYALRKAVVRYLIKISKRGENNINLTKFQQRFFALMSGFSSTITKGPAGCGKSFAMLVNALSIRRSKNRGTGINSLILVKSNSLVLQYEKIVNGILAQMHRNSKDKMDRRIIAQFLHRGTPDEELLQEDDLTDIQTPHVLISTPQRLLDILSSKGMDFVKINSLSYIGVDDFTSMIHEENLLETEKKPPIVTLLNYVLKLQDYRRQHNEPHPQVILVADEAATENLIEQVKKYTKWIDWDKFAPIGKFGEEEDIPFYKYIGDKNAVSTVLVYPKFTVTDKTENKNSNKIGKFKVNLFDMHPFQYGKNPNDWMCTLYRNEYGNSLVYKKHRNKKWSLMPSSAKQGELEILCAGLSKLLKKQNVVDWFSENKRGLVVHSDEINSSQVVELLSKKSGKKVRILDVMHDQNIFNREITAENDTQLLVINSSALTGLTFPDLDTIFVLGIDSIKTTSHFATIVGRTRNKSGLVPESEYSVFSQGQGENLDNFNPRARTFIIQPMLPDFSLDPLDRNFFERAFIVNGLVKQLEAVGIAENFSVEEENNYNSLIRNITNDDSNSTQFGGINSFNDV